MRDSHLILGSRGMKSPLAGFGASERVCLATAIEGNFQEMHLNACRLPPRYARRLAEETHQVQLIMPGMLTNAILGVKDFGRNRAKFFGDRIQLSAARAI